MKKEEDKNKNLQQKNGDQIDEKALLDVLFKKAKKTNVIYRTEGTFALWNNELRLGQVEITEDSIYLSEIVNQNQLNIRILGYLKELTYLILDGHSSVGYITLIFIRPTGAFVEMKVKIEKRDDFLSTILCLRTLLKMPYNSLMIFQHKPDFSQII